MDTETVEIECPVCDQKVRADAPRCPHCGAEFAMSGVDELERVAREINGVPTPADLAVEASTAEEETVEIGSTEREGEKETKGFFGKLFRKRH
jgi:hypothetical protein